MLKLTQEYYELDSQIKSLEERKDKLRKEILFGMKEDGKDKLEEDFGKFSIMSVRRFSYTENVIKAQENVKIMKKAEESMGLATVKVFDTLRFTSKKEEK